jgi:transposase
MSNSNVRYVGLDVHKKEAAICILDREGKLIHQQAIAMERGYLLSIAQKLLRPTDRLAFEATTNSWALARLLAPFVAEVVVSNPLATKAIAQAKVKTDKIDARVLADLLRCDYLPRVWQPDEATSLLRELTGRRSALVGHTTAIRNRIHSVLHMRLIVEPESDRFSKSHRQWLAELLASERIDAQGRLLIESDLRLLEAVEKEIEILDKELAVRGYSDEGVKLLMTLPGVSVAVAESLLAAIGDVSRFVDADHLASYLGLVPRTRQSAGRCYHGPITKAGNSQARWMLIQAAQTVRRHPGPLGYFFNKLAKRKTHNVAVVATARKLATIAWHMLTKNEPYRYATPMTTATKLASLRIAATGQRRRGGVPKGAKRSPNYGAGGTTAVKALAEVYTQEGLPQPGEATSGEARAVKASGAEAFVDGLKTSRRIPRRSATQVKKSKKPVVPRPHAS